MKIIQRKEFEKAVKTIEQYVMQQECFYIESKAILDSIKPIMVNRNDRLFDADISMRTISFLRGLKINKEITILEFSSNHTSDTLKQNRNFGKKTYDELKSLINRTGIPWK